MVGRFNGVRVEWKIVLVESCACFLSFRKILTCESISNNVRKGFGRERRRLFTTETYDAHPLQFPDLTPLGAGI